MAGDLFAGAAVRDFDAAVAWFERLVGQPAAFEAHETEWVWTLAEHRHVYVVRQPERAGHALVTWFVEDLDGFVAAAAERGVHPVQREYYDNGVTKVTYADPDGNEFGIGGVVPAERDAAV